MLEYGQSKNSLGNYESAPLIELPYGIVKEDLPHTIESGSVYQVAELILSCQYKYIDLSKCNGNDFLYFFKWIKEQLEFIAAKEKQFLRSEPEPEMLAAGIEELNIHGETLTIDSLAQGDILRYEKIQKLPYHIVFNKLFMDKGVRDFDKRFAKVMEGKK